MLGWVKLHRSIMEWGWYSHPPTRDVFIHLLMLANHEPRYWLGNLIETGQAPIGRKELSKKLGFSEQQIRTAIFNLKSTSDITIRKFNKFSLITIVKWSEYQAINQQNEKNQPAINQQSTTPKEEKKKRKEEPATLPPNLRQEVWEEFLEHRRQIKKPMTALAEKKMLNSLAKHQANGYSIEKLLNRSIEGGWQNIFLDASCLDKKTSSRGSMM